MNYHVHKPTVTIGIPAYNEARNIGTLLEEILAQQTDNFILEKIHIACDGSTDGTDKVVQRYAKKNKKIQYSFDGRRIGQAGRLNEFYRDIKTDLFITLDADIHLGNANVLNALVEAFNDPKVGLVGGHDEAVSRNTIVGKIMKVKQQCWHEMVNDLFSGNSVHHHPGCISAGRKEFLQQVRIPAEIVANDHYLYFEALRRGFTFQYAKDALVYITVPSTLADYLKQATRFHDSANEIREHFGQWTNHYYAIPLQKKIRAYLIVLIQKPLHFAGMIICSLLQKGYARLNAKKININMWEPITSSK